MKLSQLRPVLFATLLAVGPRGAYAWALQGVAPVATPPPSLAPALHFNHMPLGNVARLLSARFSIPVSLAAGATAPITGDFSNLSLRQALAAAASQANLAVVPLGSQDSAGFSLVDPSDAAKDAPAPVAVSRTTAQIQIALEQANRRREQLLRERASLLDAAARLEQ